MSLQRRLSLFFIVIVILPLMAGGFVLQRVVIGEVKGRAVDSLEPALSSTVLLYNTRAETVAGVTAATVHAPRLVTLLQRGRRAALDRFLRARLGRANAGGLDFLIALDSGKRIAGAALKRGAFARGFPQPSATSITKPGSGASAGFYRSNSIPITVRGRGQIGSVIGGYWLDAELLASSARSNVDLVLADGTKVIASTRAFSGPVPAIGAGDRPVEADLGGSGMAQAKQLADSIRVVAWTPSSPVDGLSRRLLLSLLGVLLLALVVTALLAYVLARSITQPLADLAAAAEAVSEGRYDHSIPLRSRDEVGQLAVAFNDMTRRLRSTITELSSSRDQLQRAVERVGETLRSTHDMRQILEAILNTAADAVQAEAAMMWRLNRPRDELHPIIARGVDLGHYGRVKVGTGIVGHVAERGTSILRPLETGPKPSSDEPSFPVTIAIPVYSQSRIIGVIALYRGDAARPFTYEELDTVLLLSEQGGVAIENVQLHEEAQRLSITDGLTGVWNRRYFQMQFRQVLATAIRFRRTFSVLMLDLDNFKVVNDTYGHQRGDAILVEFAQRVSKTLREVDTFARYGGEEFICLLSETDVHGALITAEKILDTIRAESFGGVGEDSVRLTVSIGAACYPDHGDSYNDLVEAADQALYRAKQEGRDRVRVAERRPPNLKLAT